MQTRIEGQPTFAHLHVELAPGETLIAEADAMASMDADLDVEAKMNGGFFSALGKKFLGGETLFVNHFTNNTQAPKHLVITQGTPGDVRQVELREGQSICFQPGAYLASTPDVKLGIRWAGLASGIAREGFIKLMLHGPGTVWYGAYGGLVEKQVEGEYIVDTSHLVGGLLGSFLGGEGLVTRVEGRGKITLQTRSLSGLAGWLNPKLW